MLRSKHFLLNNVLISKAKGCANTMVLELLRLEDTVLDGGSAHLWNNLPPAPMIIQWLTVEPERVRIMDSFQV